MFALLLPFIRGLHVRGGQTHVIPPPPRSLLRMRRSCYRIPAEFFLPCIAEKKKPNRFFFSRPVSILCKWIRSKIRGVRTLSELLVLWPSPCFFHPSWQNSLSSSLFLQVFSALLKSLLRLPPPSFSPLSLAPAFGMFFLLFPSSRFPPATFSPKYTSS